MDDRSPLLVDERGNVPLLERASAILRDEIANGALADIRADGRTGSTSGRDVNVEAATHLWEPELDGLVHTVLDLLAPLSRTSPGSPSEPAALVDHALDRARRVLEPLPHLRALRPVAPGSLVDVHTALRNDGRLPLEVGFAWSNLIAGPAQEIPASCLRPLPSRVRVPSGGSADLVIVLDVPGDAESGLYHGVFQATGSAGAAALLTFPVGCGGEEEPVPV
jgi:hypothetical protein